MKTKTDANSESVTFSYNTRGQVSRKILARVTPDEEEDISRFYTYFDTSSNLTGELKKVHYSGISMTALEYTYTRTGQLATVKDKIGERVFSYNTSLQLTKEDFDHGTGVFLGNLEINHQYESSGAHRRSAIELGSSSDTDRDLRDTYAFNSSTGRLTSISTAYSGGPKTFTYAYQSGTDLVSSITSGYYKRSTTWQKHRRVEYEVKTTWNSALRAGYEYGTDNEGRRTSEDVTGPIATKFDSSYTYGFQMTWAYTARGEVEVNNSEKLDSSGDPIEDSISLWDRNWDWDDFSNRKTEDRNDSSDTTYSRNSLNQYSSITGYLSEPGIAYDDDGNLTDDGAWDYTYDAEDRVTRMTKTGVTLTFDYDYLGRRVRKVASGGSFDGTYEYVYDGFNVIAIYRNNGRMGSYTWGPDKSGTLHGAGGVGGVLMVRGGNPSFPLYDARGNVTGYLDNYGNIYRAYQFDAFGNTVGFKLNTGVQSMDFIGFGSNFTDHESDLVDFGLRLYQPKHGRFINRDPIGEAGGANLYAYAWNDGVNRYDYLGLKDGELDPEHDWLLRETFSHNRDLAYLRQDLGAYPDYRLLAGQIMGWHWGYVKENVANVEWSEATSSWIGYNGWGEPIAEIIGVDGKAGATSGSEAPSGTFVMSGEGGTTGYGDLKFVGWGGYVEYIPREIKRGPIVRSYFGDPVGSVPSPLPATSDYFGNGRPAGSPRFTNVNWGIRGGYTDLNFTYPVFPAHMRKKMPILVTGGFIFDRDGIYYYVGWGIGTPAPGVSMTMSRSVASKGTWVTQAQGGALVTFAGGGDHSNGTGFAEWGLGTPGASLTHIYIFEEPIW